MATAYHQMRQQHAAGADNIIDLRSDTVTQPTEAMREWMAQAPVGDDVYGEDPSVNLLEQTTAKMLDKEAGLFVSSGTQSNLLALMAHCARGEEFLVGDKYHIYIDEAGGASVLGSLVSCPLTTDEHGGLQPEQITAAIKEDDPHFPITRLLCLENTAWGRVQSLQSTAALAKAAKDGGLQTHLDGARLMNAAVALEVAPTEITTHFDSVSMCLSKGLGAPVGSVLVGPQGLIDRARRLRKMLGGGTRQAGVLAAAGLYALEHNVERLRDDHKHAEQLAAGLADLTDKAGLHVEQHSNMVFMQPQAKDAEALTQHLAKHGVLIGAPNPAARLVLHMGVSEQDVAQAVERVWGFYSK